jgi:hypothetical protein
LAGGGERGSAAVSLLGDDVTGRGCVSVFRIEITAQLTAERIFRLRRASFRRESERHLAQSEFPVGLLDARHRNELQIIGFYLLILADAVVDDLFQARDIEVEMAHQIASRFDEHRQERAAPHAVITQWRYAREHGLYRKANDIRITYTEPLGERLQLAKIGSSDSERNRLLASSFYNRCSPYVCPETRARI